MLRILQKLILAISVCSIIATPSHAMFIQPDWLDPTQPGVGTNRYSYSGNDPINRSDRNGNFFTWEDVRNTIGRVFGESQDTRDQRYAEALGSAQSELDRYQSSVNAGEHDHRYQSYIQEGLDARIRNVELYSRRVENAFGSAAVDAIIMGVSLGGIKAGTLAQGRGAGAAADDLAGISQSARTGAVGEGMAGLLHSIGPKSTINLANGGTRIPDGLTRTVLSEIKNVGHQSYTRQLRDMVEWAGQNGRTVDLYVRQGTTLSGPLQRAVQDGTIRLIRGLP